MKNSGKWIVSIWGQLEDLKGDLIRWRKRWTTEKDRQNVWLDTLLAAEISSWKMWCFKFTIEEEGLRQPLHQHRWQENIYFYDDRWTNICHLKGIKTKSEIKQILLLVWYENCFSYLNKESFWSLFTLLVKSHIEYEATVWNQTQIYLINTLENVHRRTSKLVPEMSGLTHGENDLPTLIWSDQWYDLVVLTFSSLLQWIFFANNNTTNAEMKLKKIK